MIITLTGFMGCGKSTVGYLLARELGYEFIDLDKYITHKIGRTPQQIISEEGETIFRTIEAEALKDVVSLHEIGGGDLVLALGGGTPTIQSVQHLIFEHTTCIYLRTSPQAIEARISGKPGRPLFDDGWRQRLEARIPIYERAQITIDTEDAPADQIALALSGHFC